MKKTLKLTLIAIFAALCYVAFSYIKVDIPTPAGYTSVHMGNVVCCLAGLIIGGYEGGLAGAIGMAIGDLFDPKYILTTPKTIILKFIMGSLCGYLGKSFKLKEKQGKQLYLYTALSIGLTMLLNVILEPAFSYLYYDLILNNAEKAKSYLAIAKYISTSINAITSVIIGTPLYVALKKTLVNYIQ